MIVCPNCNHPNPDGAVQCEACYTPLPATSNCPSCGATVQADAAFCGQCGYKLHSNAPVPATAVPATVASNVPLQNIAVPLPPTEMGVSVAPVTVPPLEAPAPIPPVPVLEAPAPIPPAPAPVLEAPAPMPPAPAPAPVLEAPAPIPAPAPAPAPVLEAPTPMPPAPAPAPVLEAPAPVPAPAPVLEAPAPVVEAPAPVLEAPAPAPEPVPPAPVLEAAPTIPPVVSASRTQLQQVTATLFHVQTDTEIELPQILSVIHIGKPNDRIPPDVDVSGFPNSEIVSRIHADIRVEGDAHYIEDVGSSNGTYINNLPLLPGNRHRLRAGDRISLGKGDLVTFIFKLS